MRSILPQSGIERLLQRVLPLWLSGVFLTTIAGAWTWVFRHDPWSVGDWLINYQGGFVRRGLIGEIVFQCTLLTGVNPGVCVVLLQITCYGIFFLFSFKILRSVPVISPFALLVFSPFVFPFQIYESHGGYRKEILLIALLAVETWLSIAWSKRAFSIQFFLVLGFVYPLVILSHEMLAVFLPYLLAIFFLKRKPSRRIVITIALLVVPSLYCFVWTTLHIGNESQSKAIVESWSALDYPIPGGSIEYLGRDLHSAVSEVIDRITHREYLFFVLCLLLGLIGFIPLHSELHLILRNGISSRLLIVSILGSVPLFMLAVDWGRFIDIHLIALFFLVLTITKEKNVEHTDFLKKRGVTALFPVLVVVYSLSWHIPSWYCGYPFPENVNESNVFKFEHVVRTFITTYQEKRHTSTAPDMRD